MSKFLEDKPYFPFLLGNGIDSVLIDYSGSMSCNSGHLHLEQHQGTICAWYKATHRNYRKPLLPILQSNYTLIAAGDCPIKVKLSKNSSNRSLKI